MADHPVLCTYFVRLFAPSQRGQAIICPVVVQSPRYVGHYIASRLLVESWFVTLLVFSLSSGTSELPLADLQSLFKQARRLSLMAYYSIAFSQATNITEYIREHRSTRPWRSTPWAATLGAFSLASTADKCQLLTARINTIQRTNDYEISIKDN